MPSPSFTASWTLWSALETMRLPVVSRTIMSDWRIGTPEERSVPSVRVTRETAVRWTSVPVTGILSDSQSNIVAPFSVLPMIFLRTTRTTTPTAIVM